jgi:hypothetical protein
MASQPLFDLDLGELHKIKPVEMLVRFVFGAVISIVAGLAGKLLGSVAGGLLLAFPAILPATLTLLERDQGNAAAVHDVGGAGLGGVGLIAFAVVAFVIFGARLPAVVALVAALAAWGVVAVGLYVLRATGLLPVPGTVAAPGGPDQMAPRS